MHSKLEENHNTIKRRKEKKNEKQLKVSHTRNITGADPGFFQRGGCGTKLDWWREIRDGPLEK